MCLSRAYLNDREGETPVLEEISSLKVRKEELVFSTILGEEHVIKGQIKKINFAESKIIIEKDQNTQEL
ncbi:CooT family nickel-binding protein [Candidatus Bipolaricaulota bacterium]|nr:CooT family nickel-binding protein [Candidatus Bipolaricaulota bacterium]